MSRWPGGTSSQKTTFGGLTRSELMSRVQSYGNGTTEIATIRLMRKHRITGWRRKAKLKGNPDFVWPQLNLALFIDGCFWHGHGCARNLTPKTNAALWSDKIRTNRKRDQRNTRALKISGWTVVRIWECALTAKPNVCIKRIRAALTMHSRRTR
jgi:DNA mismatch endonuclease, patch repair protein